ncbi:hypothetical protein Dsin_014521 [Dipteronia sinensis]|uniref:Uncharacterized protein n=1 Tax=Dipteronia sinensis TaxID=43782 RepID=A0AAE0E9Z9_9ROSI|nr:hypothetical protein Dsin_014521 [Dipteronia sinensis]
MFLLTVVISLRACFVIGAWDGIGLILIPFSCLLLTYLDERVLAVKPYRKKGLEHYEILGDIFNTTTATVQLRFSSSQVPLPSDDDREVEDNFINSRVHVNVDVEVGDDDDDGGGGVELTEDSNKKKGKMARRSICSSSNRRKNKWESIDTYFETTKEVMQARLEKVKVKSVESTGKSCEQFSVTECMEVLESLGDIDGNTFNKFIERIVPCVEWRKAFLVMSEERKRQWLDGL